jgi:nucleotide-binding universal stress UspA family protein
MKHFRKILATTDLSSESLSTVRYAVHLAKAQNASLVVLHVPSLPAALYTDAFAPIDLTALVEEMDRAARKQLDRLVKRYAKQVPIKALVRRGIVVQDTISAVAREVGASLIVMSTHGRKGVGHFLLGSVTERVLRDAPCPVLVVRPAHRAKAATSRKGGRRLKKAS